VSDCEELVRDVSHTTKFGFKPLSISLYHVSGLEIMVKVFLWIF